MTEVVAQQSALLDLEGQELNAFWVDEKQPLWIANNPLHWKAHKLQVALARLDRISEKNPAQFNSTVYMATLDKLADLMEQINARGDDGEVLDEGGVAQERHETAAPFHSNVKPISMDT